MVMSDSEVKANVLQAKDQKAQIKICAELIQAAQKCKRNQIHAFDNFIEELADVKIMVDQMIILAGEETVGERIHQKIDQQLRRIEKEEKNNG